ncbi:hypothetical protein [Coprococcus comes]|uniref:Uncharacterized protein n=1 Tax=Coprococcus comes TaxID=410072 RepID=A0A3R5XE81_9FIRM|nr:hypothetical protein [Coprococcus comes]RGU45033.1 hypothetical protein DWW65_09895 [Coprococcus comes]
MWKIVEFRAVSQRGWGVLSGCDNNPDHNVLSRYEKIYGFLELPDTPEEKVGSLRHPGEKSHGYAAEVIVSYLEEQLICQK